MNELATFELRPEGDERVTAVITGEVDASNADLVLEQIQTGLTVPDMTVDLTGLEYLDSAGVRMLYTVAQTAAVRGTRVSVVVAADSPVRRVLALTGIDDVLPLVDPSVPDAVPPDQDDSS